MNKEILKEFEERCRSKMIGTKNSLLIADEYPESRYEIDEEKVKDFLKSSLTSLYAELIERIEDKPKHRVFECNGAHNGNGCYETWCEDENCQSEDARTIKAMNQAKAEDREIINNIFK